MLVDDPVKRLDNMTMAWGLEARTPSLTTSWWSWRLPAAGAEAGEGGKGVLKMAARGVVPDLVIDRPKGYFPVPALSTLAGALWIWCGTRSPRSGAFRAGCTGPSMCASSWRRPTSTSRPGRVKALAAGLLELWLTKHGI